jgi:hypothetical protein
MFLVKLSNSGITSHLYSDLPGGFDFDFMANAFKDFSGMVP